MLGRPHICLRCQLHLARRTASKFHVAFQSTDSKAQRSRILPGDEEDVQYPGIKRPLKLSRRPLGQPGQISEHPLGKLYGFRGQKLRENREKLSVDALGEPAEVIVLRDSRISTYQHGNVVEVEAPEPIDILAQLDAERGLVGQNEVEDNINEIRPRKEDEPRTREEFNKLVTELQNGFTVSQLARYIQSHGKSDLESSQPDNASLILQTSPWVPGISESDNRLDNDHLRGYDLQSYTAKQRLVLLLLRECWKLELHAVEEGVGQIEIELKPGDLDLLLKGAKSPISSIHTKYIVSSEEMLETFRSKDTKRSRNAIRITTTREKSHWIVEEIQQALRGIRRIQVRLDNLMPRAKDSKWQDIRRWIDTHFDDSTVDELGRITNTDIRKDQRSMLFISSVDTNPDPKTSNRTDVARRLLLTSGSFSDRVTHWLGVRNASSGTDATFVTYPLTEGLAWRERLRRWTRWTSSIQKPPGSQDEPLHKSKSPQYPSQLLESPPVGANPAQLEQQEPLELEEKEEQVVQPETTNPPEQGGYAHWSKHYDTDSSALLGSVIHSQVDPSQSSMKTLRGLDTSSTVIHSFSTSVPNLSQILTSAKALSDQPMGSLVMHFQPNPFAILPKKKAAIGSEALSAFPPIEMRFSIDPETKALNLKDIQAVVALENSDLMLPDYPVDVRFQQTTTSRLHVLHDHYPQFIIDFIKNSNLNLGFGQGRLETPPALSIPVSSHLCKDLDSELFDPDKRDAEVHDVEYLFAGLEICNSMVMEYEGWRLLYTSIEAGRAGGRRGELRLHPIRTSEPQRSNVKDFTEQAFIESALKLAETLQAEPLVRQVNAQRGDADVRRVKQKKGKDVERVFKYFAKRVSVQYKPTDEMPDEARGEREKKEDDKKNDDKKEKDGLKDV